MTPLHYVAFVPVSIRSILGPLRYGSGDPTTRLTSTDFIRATYTPDGPGTLHITWAGGTVSAQAWGTGADLLLGSVPGLIGQLDQPHVFEHAHPAIMRAQHLHPGLRLGASGDLYHELLPTIIGQRITAGEALGQWQRLCLALGDPAPGPFVGLRLPPAPARLADTPLWWFHPLGIERTRAVPLIETARHADKCWAWAGAGSAAAAQKMALLRGVGEWTIGCVLGTALGEPDAVAVGDFHLKNMVAYALAGEPRATDERMLELLQPYRGQRGRVVRLLQLHGPSAPKFGPRQRVLPMRRW
jgi:3-methyladenine DNA glycosylase/8-oxoguanine DNA glycosylase